MQFAEYMKTAPETYGLCEWTGEGNCDMIIMLGGLMAALFLRKKSTAFSRSCGRFPAPAHFPPAAGAFQALLLWIAKRGGWGRYQVGSKALYRYPLPSPSVSLALDSVIEGIPAPGRYFDLHSLRYPRGGSLGTGDLESRKNLGADERLRGNFFRSCPAAGPGRRTGGRTGDR